VGNYDSEGLQNGPAKLTWANGAVREGNKVNGKWHGEILYTYAEGPREGKKDIEKWAEGEMVESKKFYGETDQFTVENWDDLNKLTELTTS